MTESAPLTRHDLEAKIIKRCCENEEFRKEFTADATGTAVKYLEVLRERLPRIFVHEEPSDSWHIVLPPKPASADDLSQADLEKVAGGTTPTSILYIGPAMGTYTLAAAVSGGAAVGGGAAAVGTVFDQGW